MEANLPRDELGRLVVPQPFPNVARLFGVGFMLPGFKLGWDWIQALIEVGRAGAWRLWDLVGFSVWLGVMLICLVPGWIIATIRRKVVIDPGRRTVLQVNDFLIYRWSSSRSLNEFNAVLLFVQKETSTKSRRTGVSHHVTFDVQPAGRKKELLVYMDDSEDRARAVAREIAAACGLPCNDEIANGVREEEEEEED
jgi:hypothetical protein